MKLFKTAGILIVWGIIVTFGSGIGERLSIPAARHLVPATEARIGRPLTPVSVAGVARRTVRRCAVGVYNCRFPGARSSSLLAERIESGISIRGLNGV